MNELPEFVRDLFTSDVHRRVLADLAYSFGTRREFRHARNRVIFK